MLQLALAYAINSIRQNISLGLMLVLIEPTLESFNRYVGTDLILVLYVFIIRFMYEMYGIERLFCNNNLSMIACYLIFAVACYMTISACSITI